MAFTAAAAGGCAGIPSAGPVNSVPTPPPPGISGPACCGLIVVGPRPEWTQQEVVSNFLLASASFANDHAIAREYLTPAANRNWRPQSAVTILAQQPTVQLLSRHLFGPGNSTSSVLVTGEQVATLDPGGQYIPAGPGGSSQLTFGLERLNRRWYISTMPSTGLAKVSHELLLTESLFHTVYQPRNLYFYARRNHALVPDPVFVPVGSARLVTNLIEGLFADPKGWLAGAAATAFPRGAVPQGVQVVPGPGKTAIVDLGLPAAAISPAVERSLAAQLVLTLTSPAWNSPPLFQSVKIKINGRPWPAGGQAQTLAAYRQTLPSWHGNPAVYFVGADGKVRALGRWASRSTQVRGEAGSGRLALNEVAVSPDGKEMAAVAGPATTVYTASLEADGALRSRLTGTGLSAPSWDSADDLWIAGRVHHNRGVWVLLPGRAAPVRVSLPPRLGPVTALRVAWDGVRVAMIVGQGPSAHLVLAAVIRNGTAFRLAHTVPLGPRLAGVTAVTWYDGDNLLAISQGPGGAQLWEVPVNGDSASAVPGRPGMVTVTADGPQNPLYLGLSTGSVEKSVGLGEPWTGIATGRNVIYPG